MTSVEKPRFIIRFIRVQDIPAPENRSKSDPFIRSYLSAPVQYFDESRREKTRIERISSTVVTLKKLDCSHAIWNSFRDFRIDPPTESILTVEVMHAPSDTTKPDVLLGKVDIPISFLKSGEECHFELSNYKTNRAKNPKFSVILQRCFINEPPPKRKTFFLIRHGESKWNEAQSKINITGMLDRDHALTEKGVQQAKELNSRWREYEAQMHAQSTVQTSPSQPSSLPPPKPPKRNQQVASQSAPTPPSSSITSLLDGYDDFSTASSSTTTTAPATTSSTGSTPVPPPSGETVAKNSSSTFPDDAFNSDPFRSSDPFVNHDPFASNVAIVSSETISSSFVHDDNNNAVLTLEETSSSSDEEADGGEGEGEGEGEDGNADEFDDLEVVEESPDGQLIRTMKPSKASAKSIPSTNGAANGTNSANNTAASVTASTTNSNGIASQSTTISSTTTVSSPKPTKRLSSGGKIDAIQMKQRQEEYQKLFLQADKIYSSPLTRALQTAIVSMEQHPAMKRRGITLYSTIREVKNIGGLDTVGIEVGEGIEKRVRSELFAVYNDISRVNALVSMPIQFNDTYSPWWTPMTSHDNEYDQQDRVREFITFARYCSGKVPVFVGHSLFFKAFYSKRVSPELYANRRYLSDNLKKFRLSNASILAVTVSFVDVENGASDAVMIDADLIFGGAFHIHHHHHHHGLDGEKQVDGNGNGGTDTIGIAGLSIKAGQQHLKTLTTNLATNITNSLPPGFTSTLQQEVKQKKEAISKGVKILSTKFSDFFEG